MIIKLLILLCLLPLTGLGESIAPVPEDIGVLWEIEDAREEVSEPLTRLLTCEGGRLGYDAQSDTFYCPLPLDTGEWPELPIQAEGVGLMWTDDPTADLPADAMAEGIPYRFIQYDGSSFHESGLVFTGLPVLTLQTGEGDPKSSEDIPAEFTAWGEGTADVSDALIHTRGSGAWHGIDKPSWHLELRTAAKAKKDPEKDTGKSKKNKLSLLGMPEDSEWLLLGNAADHVTVSNHVCFELWNDWQDSALGCLESRLAELFVNDRYMGVYQVLQRVRPGQQIAAAGLPEDTVSARLVKDREGEKRPLLRDGETILELRYPKDDASRFSAYEDFMTLYCHGGDLNDQAFSALAENCFDMDELMRFFLFVHVTQNRDNLGNANNVFIWAEPVENGYRYHLTPWDMDGSLVCRVKHLEEGGEDLLDGLEMIERILDLNAGNARDALWRQWEKLSSGVMDIVGLCDRVAEVAEVMNASGAWRRECERWRAEEPEGEWWKQEARRWEEEEQGELTLQTQMDFITEHLCFLETVFTEWWGI